MPWGVGEIGVSEGLQLRERVDGGGLVPLVVDLTALEPNSGGEEAELYRRLIMVAEEDPIVKRGVGQGRAVAVVEVVRHLTDAPDTERILSGLVGEIDPELRLTRYSERIRIVVDVVRLEVVVPSIPEGGGDALPLALETPYAQHVALVEQPRARIL